MPRKTNFLGSQVNSQSQLLASVKQNFAVSQPYGICVFSKHTQIKSIFHQHPEHHENLRERCTVSNRRILSRDCARFQLFFARRRAWKSKLGKSFLSRRRVCSSIWASRLSAFCALVMDVVVLDIKRSARLPPARPQMPRQIKNRPLEI